jgi:hypothetical protein
MSRKKQQHTKNKILRQLRQDAKHILCRPLTPNTHRIIRVMPQRNPTKQQTHNPTQLDGIREQVRRVRKERDETGLKRGELVEMSVFEHERGDEGNDDANED